MEGKEAFRDASCTLSMHPVANPCHPSELGRCLHVVRHKRGQGFESEWDSLRWPSVLCVRACACVRACVRACVCVCVCVLGSMRLTLLHNRREQRAVVERLAIEDDTLSSASLLLLGALADGGASVRRVEVKGDGAAKGRLDEDLCERRGSTLSAKGRASVQSRVHAGSCWCMPLLKGVGCAGWGPRRVCVRGAEGQTRVRHRRRRIGRGAQRLRTRSAGAKLACMAI